MRGKWLCLILVLMLAASLLSTASAGPFTTVKYVSTQDGGTLNLRDAPSSSGSVLLKIPFAAPVEVGMILQDPAWVPVTYNGVSGYVMTRYLSDVQPAQKPNTTTDSQDISALNVVFRTMQKVPQYTGYIRPSRASGIVNIRWAPSKSSEVVLRAQDGYQVTVIAEGRYWYQVMDPASGSVGFVYRDYLTR